MRGDSGGGLEGTVRAAWFDTLQQGRKIALKSPLAAAPQASS